MTQIRPKYTLQHFSDITFNGFDIQLPEKTMAIISELALQVGSPTYIRTPIFAKNNNMCKPLSGNGSTASSGSGLSYQDSFKKKKSRRSNVNEIINDEDWESIRTFHTTKLEQKDGIDGQIDLIRSSLNKMTDNNYQENCKNIIGLLDIIIEKSSQEDILKVFNQIFEIASNNRFYSKLYADLLSKLICKYTIMRSIFEKNFDTFLELFTTIEHSNADEDYDKFCKVNRDNERRKALSAFFVNLTSNEIISKEKLLSLFVNLLNQVYYFIKMDNKKSEVDEIVENISILYNKKLVDDCTEEIDGKSLTQIIKELSSCKAKTYPSLTSKSIFKFMDILEL